MLQTASIQIKSIKMKEIILITLFHSFCFFGGAGTELYAQPQKADSIQKLLSKYNSKEERYLPLLNALSLTQVDHKPEDALATVNKAVSLAQESGNQKELAAAYNNKGFIVMRMSNFEEAKNYFQKAFTINTDLKNEYGLADSYCNMGTLLMYRSEHDSAKKYLFTAIQMYEKTQNKNGLADANYYLAGVYWFLRNLKDMNVCLEKALHLYEQTGNENGMAVALTSLGAMELSLYNMDKGLDLLRKGKELNEKINNVFGLGQNYLCMGMFFYTQSNYLRAIESYHQALRLHESIGWKPDQVAELANIGSCYGSGLKQHQKGLDYDMKALELLKTLNNKSYVAQAYWKMSEHYSGLKQYDKAIECLNQTLSYTLEYKDSSLMSLSYTSLGKGYDKAEKYDQAIPMFQKALALDKIIDPDVGVLYDMFYMSNSILKADNATLLKAGINPAEKKALAVKYMQQGITLGKRIGDLGLERDALLQLSSFYEDKNDLRKSLDYYKQYDILKDTILNRDNAKYIANVQMQYDSEKKEQQIELLNKDKVIQEKEINKQKTTRNAFIAGFILVLLLIGVTLNRYRIKQKANHELSTSLEQLKQTQKQLIQSEKMASLGELTAGIAHEIQNPLNFVNNFSEVSNELIDEMKTELSKGNFEDAKLIADDVKLNLEKINQHGKRADAIVKGMLQHSRSSSGQKEPTDINALADEYLRLAYHGLRAKDKSFNATLKTTFDESVGKISIIPQDIGRVILNLITNAFYAVDEKKKTGIDNLTAGQAGYEPTVSVSTKKNNDHVEITVADNGEGIARTVLDKIFQPFFTTKPTGQGTGLGLSLAYDIVKAHGGELKVETKEGEGTEFMIILPLPNQIHS